MRIQVSLDEREYALAEREAKALGISIADYVRRVIRESLPSKGNGRWMRYEVFVQSGNPSSSQSIDEIVYRSQD